MLPQQFGFVLALGGWGGEIKKSGMKLSCCMPKCREKA